jgi:rhodanese-related sulfurtransferase
MRLARVGIEDLPGYLDGGIEGWKRTGFALARLQQVTVQELSTRLQSGGLQVLDVRREGEWQAGHIADADWYPLDRFKAALPHLEQNALIAVHCKSGYRSMIACSLLQRAGYSVINVIGGFDAWEQATLPVVSAAAVSA